MSPTPEASERQRKAAFKAWETIRRKRGENPKTDKGTSARKKWNAHARACSLTTCSSSERTALSQTRTSSAWRKLNSTTRRSFYKAVS
jgi:hypothetical protein